MTELHHQTLAELAAGLTARRFSSVEVVKHFLGRIERLNPDLNAFVTVTAEQGRMVFLTTVLLVPGLILLAGVAAWWRRR